MYIDSKIVSYGTMNPTQNISRFNYIGKSKTETIPAAKADLDDLKIFNEALDSTEIQNIMN